MKINKKENVMLAVRGLPGSGKTTLLKRLGLIDTVVSPDEWRSRLRPPVLNASGMLERDQSVGAQAWAGAYLELAARAKTGGAIAFDATLMTAWALSDLERHVPDGYTLVIVDFGVNEELALSRNEHRREEEVETFDGYGGRAKFRGLGFVPEFVIHRMAASGRKMSLDGFTVVRPDDLEVVA